MATVSLRALVQRLNYFFRNNRDVPEMNGWWFRKSTKNAVRNLGEYYIWHDGKAIEPHCDPVALARRFSLLKDGEVVR